MATGEELRVFELAKQNQLMQKQVDKIRKKSKGGLNNRDLLMLQESTQVRNNLKDALIFNNKNTELIKQVQQRFFPRTNKEIQQERSRELKEFKRRSPDG